MQKLENRPNSIWIQIHTNILVNCSATQASGGLSTRRRWTALIHIFKLVQLIISPRQQGAPNWNLGRGPEGVSDGCRLLLMGDLLSHFYKLGFCLLRQPVPHLLINSLIERISLAVTTWIERGNSKLRDELSHRNHSLFTEPACFSFWLLHRYCSPLRTSLPRQPIIKTDILVSLPRYFFNFHLLIVLDTFKTCKPQLKTWQCN